MKKIICILLLPVLLFSLLQAQINPKQIAVLNLSSAGISPTESITLTDRLRSELVNTREFRVIERDKMEEILTEQGLQQSGCTSDECAVEIGKLLNIHQICAGSVGKVGSLYTVILRLIDVESGQILTTVTEDCKCPIEQLLTSSMHNLAIRLVEETKKYPGLFIAKGGIGDLYLKSSLTSASIYVDGQPLTEKTPTTIKNLPSGEHVIKVVKDDYAGSKIVIINPNEIVDETIEMGKSKGGMKLYTDIAGVDIFIEDRYYGQTPKIIKDLMAGEYLVTLKKEGYMELKRRIKINGDAYTSLDEHMVKPATLSINSTPTNATVFIRGQEMGKTPLQLADLYPEKVFMEILYPGFKTERKYIQLTESAQANENLNLKKLPALSVTSDPPGASVYINDKVQGLTPLSLNDLSDDKLRVIVKKNYFNDWQQDIVLQTGMDQHIFAKLTFTEGNLVIGSEPSGKQVLINGVPAGKTPLRLVKPYGEYEIVINDVTCESLQERIFLNSPEVEKKYKLIHRQGEIKFNGLAKDTDLFIDGKKFVLTSPEVKLPVGSYRIKVKKAGYKTYAEKVDLLSNPSRQITISFAPKTKTEALLRSAFVPGWGQAYQDKPIRTWLYPLTVFGLGVTSFFMTSAYNDNVSSYNAIRQDYLDAFDPGEINSLRQQMDDAYDQVEKSENIRNFFYIATGLAWLWNMLDTLVLPPGWSPDVQLSSQSVNSNILISLSFDLSR